MRFKFVFIGEEFGFDGISGGSLVNWLIFRLCLCSFNGLVVCIRCRFIFIGLVIITYFFCQFFIVSIVSSGVHISVTIFIFSLRDFSG